MGLDVLDNIKVLHISEPITPTELFARVGKLAIDSGWAREGFIQALTEREARYPTGLHTAGVEVAIPHADPEWTLQPGMVVCIANPPVPFQPMGGLGGEVQARFIFLLTIPSAEAHIDFLQALATVIEDEERLKELEETQDINRLIEYLRQAVEA